MAKRSQKVRPIQKPQRKRQFFRAWREHRQLTLEQLAERLSEAHGVTTTHATLSRIERGLQNYTREILEALAAELTGGDIASLFMRDPSDPEGIWTVWDQASAGQKQTIVEIAKTVVKTGTGG